MTKFCQRCGKILWDVASNRKYCTDCVRKRNNEKGKARYAAKKKAEAKEDRQFIPKKPPALKRKIKPLEQCVREAKALDISYGEYVLRGLDKEDAR